MPRNPPMEAHRRSWWVSRHQPTLLCKFVSYQSQERVARMSDYTPYQKKIIKRYYDHADDIGYQRLSELVSELYLAEGKKLDSLWKQVEKALAKVKVDAKMVEH